MLRLLVIAAVVVVAGCTQQPSAVLYLDPKYDYVGAGPPAGTRDTLDRVFAGVKFGGSPVPARRPDDVDERLRTGSYRPFGAPAPAAPPVHAGGVPRGATTGEPLGPPPPRASSLEHGAAVGPGPVPKGPAAQAR